MHVGADPSQGVPLSQIAERVLGQAAVLGREFCYGALAAVVTAESTTLENLGAAPAPVAELPVALRELLDRGYLRESSQSALDGQREFSFVHAAQQAEWAECCDPDLARRRHRVAALWLKHKLCTTPECERAAVMFAAQLTGAGRQEEAVAEYLRAGELARSGGAPERALEHYFEACSLVADTDTAQRFEAVRRYAETLVVLGRSEAALSAFQDLLALAHELRNEEQIADTHFALARLNALIGHIDSARYHFEAAFDGYYALGNSHGTAAVREQRGQMLWMLGDYGNALLELETAAATNRVIADERALSSCLSSLSLVWLDVGDAARASSALESALQSSRRLCDELGEARALETWAVLAAGSEDASLALRLLKAAHAAAARVGHRPSEAGSGVRLGEAYLALGRTEEALAVLTHAERLARELASTPLLISALSAVARAYFELEQIKAARGAIREAVALAGELRSKAQLVRVLRTLGELVGAGLWGPEQTEKATQYLLRSASLAAEIKTELELSKTCRSFCAFSPHLRSAPDSAARRERILSTSNAVVERFREAVIRSSPFVAA